MVSIIIVTMGKDAMLAACLDTLREHVAEEYEIILVNNAARPLALKADQVIENGQNLGFARAVNRGIRAARGEWVLLLNPDTRFTEDVISPMVAFLQDHPQAGMCGIQLTFPDGRPQNSIDVIPSLAHLVLNKALLKLLFPHRYPSKRSGFTAPQIVPSVIGACLLIRREMLDAIGLLDEGFFFYLEETDLCKRAGENGYEVWHLPDLRLIHLQGATARTFDVRRKIEFNRSLLRFFRKHGGPVQAVIFILLSILKNTLETAAHLPLAFLPAQRARLVRSAAVLAWLVGGRPEGMGLEGLAPRPRIAVSSGYRWLIHPDAEMPQVMPGDMLKAMPETLNNSRTTLVRRGQVDGRQVYLKRYNRKGPVDTLKNCFRPSRAFRSFRAGLALEGLGIATPRPLFACERRRCGILLESYIATAGIPAQDLVAYVEGNGASSRLVASVADFVRRLHEMGVFAVDLKGENLLVDELGRVFLIDLDRMRRRRFLRLDRIARNLSYLNASFARSLPREVRLGFLDEYLKGRPSGRHKEALIAMIERYTVRRLERRY